MKRYLAHNYTKDIILMWLFYQPDLPPSFPLVDVPDEDVSGG